MNVEHERSSSLWMDVPPPASARLTEDLTTDVLVVGAGIAGLSIAYELAVQGRQVAIVDRGRPTRGQTARTTAHLSFEADDYYRELIKVLGEARARQYYESQAAAVDRIEEICAAEGLDCDFARLDGYFIPARDEDVDGLREELQAAQRVGYSDAGWAEAGQVPGLDVPAMRCPRQGRFHPLKYLNGLAAALEKRGVRLFGDTPIQSLEERGGQAAAQTADGRTIVASQAVAATNTPFHLKVPVHSKQAPYRTYVAAFAVPKGSVADVLVWDTEEPGYHYVRLQPEPDRDVLIVGGEDHKSGEEDDGEARIARLEAWARARWPQIGERLHAWSGQVYEPVDYAPFIGRTHGAERIFLVTGDSGQGITTGVAASLVLRELMAGRESSWAEVYDPSRTPLRAAREYAAENLSAVKGLAEHILPADGSVDEVAKGEAAVVRIGGELTAVYRDEAGELHARSAACTHLGCAVRWNSFEGCWDCPCHGSQFGVDGEVLAGPATAPLAAADLR